MRAACFLAVGLLIGCEGETGPRGPEGEPGEPGESAPGAPGKDGVDGTDGIDGTDGTDGTDGVDGAMGPPGPAGPEGDPGPGVAFFAGNTEVPVRTIGGVLVQFDTNGRVWRTNGAGYMNVTTIYYSGSGCSGTASIHFDQTPLVNATFFWDTEYRAVSMTAAPANMNYASTRSGGPNASCVTSAGNVGSAVLLAETASAGAGPGAVGGFLRPELL